MSWKGLPFRQILLGVVVSPFGASSMLSFLDGGFLFRFQGLFDTGFWPEIVGPPRAAAKERLG